MPVFTQYQFDRLMILSSIQRASLRSSISSTLPPSISTTDVADAVDAFAIDPESDPEPPYPVLNTPTDSLDVESRASSPHSPAYADSIHTVGTSLGRVTGGYSQAFDLPPDALEAMYQLLGQRSQNGITVYDQESPGPANPPSYGST